MMSIDQDWSKPGSKNKLTNKRDTMYVCPECGHHALAVATNGWFHCWACGLWGLMGDSRRQPAAARHSERIKTHDKMNEKMNSRTVIERKDSVAVQAGGEVTMQLSDYVSLPPDVLRRIEPVSTDDMVSGMQADVRRYLAAMGISPEHARRMGWGVARWFVKAKDEEKGGERTCLVYCNWVDGYLCNAKFRSIDRKGFAQESSVTPCAPYGIDCLNPNRRQALTARTGGDDPEPLTLYVTEGEKDYATLRMLLGEDTRVISVANGSRTDHARSFEAFAQWLQPVRRVVICGDQDRPGRQMAADLAACFEDRQVSVVSWDQRLYGKDISDVYLHHGRDAALVVMSESTHEARRDDIEDFLTDDALGEVVSAARCETDRGYSIGIGPLTDAHLRLWDSGGLCIVTGKPGVGKTDWLNFMTMALVHEHGCHVCFCSFETPDKRRHAGQLTRIWAGDTDLQTMSPAEVMPLARAVTSRVTHIDLRRQRPTYQTILRRAETVMALHPDMRYLVIDPYLYVEVARTHQLTETDAIKELLVRVQDWAWAHGVWVFLVAHPRKLRKDDGTHELEEIDYYTISGSAHWANVADLVFSLKRVTSGRSDYTVLSVLKVRDQSVCTPGDLYYNRQLCGRYDERASEQDAIAGRGQRDVMPWE